MTAADAVPVQAAPAAEAATDLAAREGLRCTVRLPMNPQGWDTVLARCDGRPVAIGDHTAYRVGGDAAQYAQDMQVIVTALSRPPPGFPLWLKVLAALLGAGVLYEVLQRVARHLPHWPDATARAHLLERLTRRQPPASHH